MFESTRRNPTISVLLLGGSNDHTLHRTLMLSREFIVPSTRYGKWERYVRTSEMHRVADSDGVVGTYRGYTFECEVKR